MREQWDELKETIIELRDNNGTATQQECCQFLANLMTVLEAQMAPARKKGKWIRENIVLTSNPPQYQWHCSECGRMVHWFTAEVLTDFCPNCGADMRKIKNG